MRFPSFLFAGLVAACSSTSATDATVIDAGALDAPDAPLVDAPSESDAVPFEASLDGADADEPDTNQPDADASNQRFSPYPATPYPLENPPTQGKALLGKMLFWDEQLSSDDSVACGTCHRPAAGGSDPRTVGITSGHPGPDGVLGTADDPHGARGIARCTLDADAGLVRVSDPVFGYMPQVTRRKPPSFLDDMFLPMLFVDGRAGDRFDDPSDVSIVAIAAGGALESQAMAPLVNPAEMACDDRSWADVVAKLDHIEPLALAHGLPPDLSRDGGFAGGYPALFEAAFGSAGITPVRIAFAIATYERTLRSDQTPWDRWAAGEDGALSTAALRGFALFMSKGNCTNNGFCHQPPMFGVSLFFDTGFVEPVWDHGREEVTGSVTDRGAFRVTSLRNVGLREPGGLLHDGTGPGKDLNSVMQGYTNTKVSAAINNLTPDEIADVIIFMREGLTDPRVRDETAPFDRPRLATEP